MEGKSPSGALKRKLVIIGDGACGKTSLLTVFVFGYFPTHYIPTVFENYVTDCRLDGKDVQLALWDTAGQEDYEKLRPLAYAKTHVILIAFSVDNSVSLENVRSKWSQEAQVHCRDTPIILVGLKADLREEPSEKDNLSSFTTPEQIEEVRREIEAKKYIECSSLKGTKVDDVFEIATRLALAMTESQPRKGLCCCRIM